MEEVSVEVGLAVGAEVLAEAGVEVGEEALEEAGLAGVIPMSRLGPGMVCHMGIPMGDTDLVIHTMALA